MSSPGDPTAGKPGSHPPWIVIVVGVLFVLVGVSGMVAHAHEVNVNSPVDADLLLATVVRGLAIVGGIFVLRGANWARWLLIGWTLFHVILSIVHPLAEFITHCVIAVGVSFFLLRPSVTAFIHSRSAPSSE